MHSAESLREKEKGNEYLKIGKLQDALDAYSKSIDLDPTNISSISNRALVQLKLNNNQEAAKDCLLFLESDPNNVKVLWRSAVAHWKLKKLSIARSHFLQALKQEPGNEEIKKDLDEFETSVQNDESNRKQIYPPMSKYAPAPPQNSYTFERDWRELKNIDSIYEYIKSVDINLIPEIFRNGIDPDHLIRMIQVMDSFPLDVQWAGKFISAITNTPRFELVTMMLSDSEQSSTDFTKYRIECVY